MQAIRQRVHVLAQLHQVAAHGATTLARPRPRLLHAAGIDGEARKPLREVVVQLAREVLALVLVRRQQAAAQVQRVVLLAPPPRALEEERSDEGGLNRTIAAPQDQRPVLFPEGGGRKRTSAPPAVALGNAQRSSSRHRRLGTLI